LRAITAASPTTAALVSTAIKILEVRKDTADPGGFASSSWPRMAGRAALTNAHRPDLEDAWVTDALVHESIHALLNMVEPLYPLYRLRSAAFEFGANSPWSGRFLKMHSYVHACFVWFGLWCFWSLAVERATVPVEIGEPFRDRARQGLEQGNLLAALGEGKNFLTDEVIHAVHTIEHIVARS
jgi:HEXXH motif-containing protein